MKRGRVAIFVTLVVGINMIGVASTRPQLHQWWSLSLIGPMSVFFAIRLFLQKLPSVTFQSGLKTIKSIFSPLKGLSQLQRILPVALVFIVLTFFVGFLGKIGNINHLFSTFSSQQFKELQKSFNKLEWNPLELKANVEGDSPSIAIPNNVGAVQITTNANCTLSGLQVTFKRQSNLNSARYANGTLDRRVIVGETQSRKLYLNLKVPSNFSQQIFVWLPKFEKKCNLRVQTATLGSSLPAIALLIGDFVGEAHYHKKFSFRNVPTEDIRKFEFLNHQIRFRGYPKTNGYRAIGDDSNFGRPESQIGQRVLGTSFQGYMSVDLWSKTVPGHIAESSRSVTYDINLKRGVFAIGVTSSSEQNNVIEGYSVVGKGLQTSKRNFRGCFNIPQNPDSILFVASIVDMYSPRYLDASINSITFSTDTCSEGHRALLPTL
jgi:hypothetical protein